MSPSSSRSLLQGTSQLKTPKITSDFFTNAFRLVWERTAQHLIGKHFNKFLPGEKLIQVEEDGKELGKI